MHHGSDQLGTVVRIAMRDHDVKELEKLGLVPEIVDARLIDLQNTFDEWHGQVPDGRLEELTAKIFDGAPELNLTNSRD